MLNKETFFKGMDKLVNAFPNWRLNYDDPEVMKDWYSFFEYMDDERFLYMVDAYINFSNRFPTVAGLKECDTIPRKSKEQLKHEQMLRENGLL